MADKEIPDIESAQPGGPTQATTGDKVHAYRAPNSRVITFGDAAGKSVGTGAGSVAAGDDSRFGTAETALQPTAQRRNRVVNPAMQISQENVNNSGTTSGFYLADQWAVNRVTSAGTITAQRVQAVTPNGSKDRARVTITAADASLAAGEYLTLTQNIEGQEVADLRWGAATAVDVVVRFGFKGPAGTYGVRVANSAAIRSFIRTFTIAPGQANTDTEQEVVVPGDQSGTWLKDNGIGLTLDIVLAAGTTFQSTADAWQAGNYLGTAGMSNGMATAAAVFEIFDVGLYADPNGTGVAPEWELPSVADELRRCQRYWEKSYDETVTPGTVSALGAEGVFFNVGVAMDGIGRSASYQTTKCRNPTVVLYSPVTGAASRVRGSSADYNYGPSDIGRRGFNLVAYPVSGGALTYHWTANARL